MAFVDKAALRAHMLALEQAALALDLEQAGEHLAASHLDQTTTRDTDDMSQARDEADKAFFFDRAAGAEAALLDRLRQIDFGPKSEITEGAAFALGRAHYVVAIATGRFDFGGRTFMGISAESPIYQALEGARAGDTVDFRGRRLRVTAVA